MIADLRAAARALGGEVSGRGIVCPGPGHSHRDRSLSVLFSPYAPDGFVVRSHAGDNDMAAKDYIRERLRLEPREQNGNGFRSPQKRNGFAFHAVVGDDRANFPNWEIGSQPHDDDRRARAVALFYEGRAPIGSPVEAYLLGRGVDLPDEPARVLRFHEHVPFAGHTTPAMVALVTGIVDNFPRAVHRTALDYRGRKITVGGKDKLALGPTSGGAVKLTSDEEVTTCLGIGEGIETTLSLRRLPEFGASPVWSLLSAGGVSTFPVLPGIEVLWIATDHDPAGERAARTCADRWREAGSEVFLVKPKAAKADLNDIITGGRRHG